MSGWVKFEKDLQTDPRVLRIAKQINKRFWIFTAGGDLDPCNALPLPGVTLVSGALLRMWCYADSHIRDDDTLDVSCDELDEIIGIPGFCALLPPEWLTVVDEFRVELPAFQAKNGTEAKSKALTAKRVSNHRKRNTVTDCNATPLPDQTRLDQTRPEEITAVAPPSAKPQIQKRKPSRDSAPDPEWLTELRGMYPSRAGDTRWAAARRAINARLEDGHTVDELRDGVSRYAAYVRAVGSEGTQFVKTASVFFGPDKPFLDAWTPPRETAKPEAVRWM